MDSRPGRAMFVSLAWSGPRGTVTEIDGANTIAAVFFGGFGLLAAFWLTRSMGRQRTGRRRHPDHAAGATAALCVAAIVPFGCGCGCGCGS